jgi:hypothetical protein
MKITSSPYLWLTIASLLFFAITIIFYQMANPVFVSENLLLIVPFFYMVSIITSYLHKRMKRHDVARIKLHYMIMSAVKMFFYVILLVIYGFVFRHDVAPFFVSFLIFYLIYTLLEVKSSLFILSQ